MFNSTITQSRKRKLEDMSLGTTKANFFRRRPMQNEIFHYGPSHAALSPPPRILPARVRQPHRSSRRRLQSKKVLSSSSSRANADCSQHASVDRDSVKKTGLKKSISKLPQLFSRLLRLDSKSDNKSVGTTEGECSAGSVTAHLQTSKTKSSRWTKFAMQLAGNRIPSPPQQSESLTSFVSVTHSSLYPNRGLSTMQVDKATSSKLRQLPTSKLPKKDAASSSNQETVTGEVRKICRSRRTIRSCHQTGDNSRRLSSSVLPHVIGSIDDDFALVIYPKHEPSSTKVRSRSSIRNVSKKRHTESKVASTDFKSWSKKIIPPFKYQQPTQSSIIKSNQTTSISKFDPFGDIPPIPVPVLEPIRVKQPSWKKIQRKFSRKVFKRQLSEPMEISCSSDQDEDSDNKNPTHSEVPGKLSSSSESYPFGEVPSIVSPVLKPVYVEVTKPSVLSVRDISDEKLPNVNLESSPVQSADSNVTSLEDVGKNVESSGRVTRSSNQPQMTANPLERRPRVFTTTSETLQAQMPATSFAMSNFSVDGTNEIVPPGSLSRPQFPESSYEVIDRKVYGRRCHTDSRDSHPQTYSSHTFSQPASTQILKPAQNEEVSIPVSLHTRVQQISDPKSSISRSTSHYANVDVKFCPQLVKITHSSLSTDSSGAVQSTSPPELDLECAGQICTSTSTFLGSLPPNKMLEPVPGTSSINALTSVLSSPSRPTSFSSTSSSGNSLESTNDSKSAHATTKRSTFIAEPGYSGRIMNKSAKTEASKPNHVSGEGSLQVRTTSSSFSSSSTIFQNSPETINGTSTHINASLSLTNLLLADSVTSGSVGSDAGNSSDLRGIAEGQDEFGASSSLAAVKVNDSHNVDTSRGSLSLVRQKSIKIKRNKSQGKRRFFGKLMSAFSTTDTNRYKKLPERKSDPPVPGKKKSMGKSKEKPK